ncbi:MAG: DUF4198 domain-containing protein [Bryobacteraceae bacterium]
MVFWLGWWPVALWGHDMWIEPTSFRPEAGQLIGVKLRVGQELLGDAIPRNARAIREFVVADASGRQTVMGREGSDPAGFLRVANAGVAVIGYSSHASSMELPADQFNAYLKEEGLEAVMAERARRKQGGAKARELFSRCAKSLLATGATAPGQGDRALGFPLELVAERNPYGLGPGEALPVRLTYENRPLAGALVVALNRLQPGVKVTARTDREGRVRLRLPGDGMWMVKAVHMIPAPAGAEAEWASYWASLTFAMGSK